jgi:hypothetical protein
MVAPEKPPLAHDCTGVMLIRHMSKYQARIAMADMAGPPVAADYRWCVI